MTIPRKGQALSANINAPKNQLLLNVLNKSGWHRLHIGELGAKLANVKRAWPRCFGAPLKAALPPDGRCHNIMIGFATTPCYKIRNSGWSRCPMHGMKSATDQIEDGANVWQADYFRHSWRFALCAFHSDENTHNRRATASATTNCKARKKKAGLAMMFALAKSKSSLAC